MKDYITFKTKNKNYYFYSYSKKEYILLSKSFYEYLNNNLMESKKKYSKMEGNRKRLNLFSNSGSFKEIKSTRSKVVNKKEIENSLKNLKHILFETTLRCNLNCTYCINGKMYSRIITNSKRDQNFEAAKNFLDFMSKYWNDNSSIKTHILIGFYGGEPLLNFAFIEKVVNYLNSSSRFKSLNFKFQITTNGTLLGNYFKFLEKNKFTITVSLDGDKQSNSYRPYHNNLESHSDILENILKIKKNFPDYFKEYVHFNTILHDRNTFNSLSNYFEKTFDKMTEISELDPSDIKSDSLDLFRTMYTNLDKYSDDDKFEEFEESRIGDKLGEIISLYHRSSNSVFKNIIELFNNSNKKTNIPTGTCIPFSKRVFITNLGDILSCEQIDRSFILGTIDEKEVLIDLEKVTNNFNELVNNYRDLCKQCYQEDTCKICIYQNIKEFKKTGKCSSFMNKMNYAKYLGNIFSYFEDNYDKIDKHLKGVVIK